MTVACTNCGPELTALGNLTAVNAFSGPSATLNLTCTNCTSLTSFGIMTNLQGLIWLGGANATMILTCVDCPALTTMFVTPNFAYLAWLDTSSGPNSASITVSCTNCPALTTLGDLSWLQSLVYPMDSTGVLEYSLLSLSCTNCPLLTSLANMPYMNTLVDVYSTIGIGNVTLAVTCTHCTVLPVIAYVPKLGELAYLDSSGTTATLLPGVGMAFSCVDCPGLNASMIMLAGLSNFLAVSSAVTGISAPMSLSASCVDCPNVLYVLNAPVLQTISAGSTISVTCINCQTLFYAASMVDLVYSINGTIELNVANTTALAYNDGLLSVVGSSSSYLCGSGSFDMCDTSGLCSSVSAADALPLGLTVCPLCTLVQNPVSCALGACCVDEHNNYNTVANTISSDVWLTCTNCSSLTTLGMFAYLTTFTNDATLTIECTNCSALESMGSFSALSYLGDDTGNFGSTPVLSTGSIILSCVDCPKLTTFGVFSALSAIDNAAGGQTTSTLSLACTQCPMLTNFAVFNYLTTLATSRSLSYGYTATSLAALSIQCTGCNSLQTLFEVNNLAMIAAAPVAFTTAQSTFNASCTDCPALTSLGMFPQLQQLFLGPGTGTGPINLTCNGCPLFAGLTTSTFSGLPISAASAYGASIYLKCYGTGCAQSSFAPAYPIVYQFDHWLPNVLGPNIANGAGLILSNLNTTYLSSTAATVLGSLANITRLSTLQIEATTALTTLDAFVSLQRIDGALTITGNAALTNVDGVSLNLEMTGSVTIEANPMLCSVSVNTAKFGTISQLIPTITDNGYQASSSSGGCAPLVPAAPSAPTPLAVTSSGVLLSWPIVQQPSVAVIYTLTMSGVQMLSYASHSPPALPIAISSLSPATSYTFVLSATLGTTTVQSPLVVVTTSQGASTSCSPGSAMTSSGCVACSAGTYVAPNGTHCALCTAGTFAAGALNADNTQCLLCPAGTYSDTPGSGTCISCAYDSTCPAGSAVGTLSNLPTNSSLSSAQAMTAAAAGNNSGLSVGYILIIVFVGSGLTITAVVFVARKRTHTIVHRFGNVMRTPRWLLSVDTTGGEHLSEPPSFVRGLVGIWIVLAVVLVTIYQIDNYVQNQFSTDTSLQPGTTFESGVAVTAVATTQLAFVISLLGSSVTCDPSAFIISVSLGSSAVNASCTTSSNGSNTTIVATTVPNALLTTSTAATAQLLLTISSPAEDQNPVFTPAIQYTLTATQYDGSQLVTAETILPPSGQVIAGTTTVSLAAVAAEVLDISGAETGSPGYVFSYTSTFPGTTGASPGPQLVLSIELGVPSYYLRVAQVQAISVLSLLSGILAIAGGVVAAGTVVAFVYSFSKYEYRSALHRSNIAVTLAELEKPGEKYPAMEKDELFGIELQHV